MMTTLGATISNTLVNALLSWWTTSFPASAAAGATVELGPVSGWARGGAARREKVAKARTRNGRVMRMTWDLDRNSTTPVQLAIGEVCPVLLLIMILLLLLVSRV